MTDEQIVEAAKSAEKKTEFGGLVHSKVSQGVNSAYGIGFLDGAEWTRKQMMEDNEYICKDTLLEWLEQNRNQVQMWFDRYKDKEDLSAKQVWEEVIAKINDL